jgi:hypothetical protein
MKLWSAFYPDVLPELPGAPLPMVDHWLRNVTIDFCERSKAYVADLALIDAVAEQMSYPLVMPAGTELVDVVSAWFIGEEITPKSPGYLKDKFGDWMAETGTPEHFTHQATDAIMLVPAPADAATDALKIKASIRPALTATGVDDWFYSQYRLALAAGCKAKMMAMKDVPWADPERVALNLSTFEAAISKAIGAAANGFTRARPRFNGGFV